MRSQCSTWLSQLKWTLLIKSVHVIHPIAKTVNTACWTNPGNGTVLTLGLMPTTEDLTLVLPRAIMINFAKVCQVTC